MQARRWTTLWRTRTKYQRSQRDTSKKQSATAVGQLLTSSFDSTPRLQLHFSRRGRKLVLELLDRYQTSRFQTEMLMVVVVAATLACQQQMKMKMTYTVKSARCSCWADSRAAHHKRID